MIMLWNHSLLQEQSDTFIVGLLVVSAARPTQATLRDLSLYVSCGTLLGQAGVPSDAGARWHRGQSANPFLLHCCTAAALLSLY